ncbi:serine/arginine-rich splicing factor [Anaeramoeba ignava]|uniref:Serine/arginine-rich splicing factor n=1 Tax=Anaeramoeba ignava TaxID=1746090 RepID=A0A9Q0RDH1_ANAIG|nr:serine/arginine-rich splicing factor [Anaeramoeba ignava]
MQNNKTKRQFTPNFTYNFNISRNPIMDSHQRNNFENTYSLTSPQQTSLDQQNFQNQQIFSQINGYYPQQEQPLNEDYTSQYHQNKLENYYLQNQSNQNSNSNQNRTNPSLRDFMPLNMEDQDEFNRNEHQSSYHSNLPQNNFYSVSPTPRRIDQNSLYDQNSQNYMNDNYNDISNYLYRDSTRQEDPQRFDVSPVPFYTNYPMFSQAYTNTPTQQRQMNQRNTIETQFSPIGPEYQISQNYHPKDVDSSILQFPESFPEYFGLDSRLSVVCDGINSTIRNLKAITNFFVNCKIAYDENFDLKIRFLRYEESHFCFVEFETEKDVDNALKFDQMMMGGISLKVYRAETLGFEEKLKNAYITPSGDRILYKKQAKNINQYDRNIFPLNNNNNIINMNQKIDKDSKDNLNQQSIKTQKVNHVFLDQSNQNNPNLNNQFQSQNNQQIPSFYSHLNDTNSFFSNPERDLNSGGFSFEKMQHFLQNQNQI